MSRWRLCSRPSTPPFAAELIDPNHASLERRPGDPRSKKAVLDPAADPARRHVPPPLADAHDTTTCLVADRFGNVVAATPSGWSGSRGRRHRRLAGQPPPELQHLGRPSQRDRARQAPAHHTLAHPRAQGSRPVLAVSVAGGDNQDQMTLQLLLNHIDFGLEPAASVVAPRFMSDHFINSFRQTPPALGRLRINPDIGSDILEAFKAAATS